MNILVTLFVVVSIACSQVHGENSLPENLVEASKYILKNAPASFSPEKVQEAIDNPSENVADQLSFFDPANTRTYQRYAGFNIPFNRPVLVSLLKKNLKEKKLDLLSIITTIIASIKIPPAGILKDIGLYLVKKFLCIIVECGNLPGLEKNVAFIMRTVRDKNQIQNALGKSIIKGVRGVPILGGFLSNISSNVFSLIPGITEILRVYADNPLRFLNALKGVADDTALTSKCTPAAKPEPAILPFPPVIFGPGPVIPPNA